jgi:ATP-dependent helicase/nuclease subunit B
MDAFVDFLFEEALELPEKKLEAIDAVALLFQIHIGDPNRLGGSGFLNAANFLPLGLKLYRDLEELLIEGVTPEEARQVDGVTGISLPMQSQERLQSLSFFYEKFYGETKRVGLTTRSERYRAVAAEMGQQSLSGFENVVLAGFFALSQTERDIFRKLAPLKQFFFVVQDGPGIAGVLEELGLDGEGLEDLRDKAEPQPKVDVRFHRSPDTHGQVFGLNRVLAEADHPYDESDRHVIVVPSAETLFPLIHNCIALSGDSAYNISLGYPLVRTPVYGFLRSLAEVVITVDSDRIHVPTYLAFVLHPYTKNIYFQGRTDVTRMLFHGIETALTNKQRKFVTLAEVEESNDLFDKLAIQLQEPSAGSQELKEHIRKIHDRTIRKFLWCRDLEDFAGKVIELIQFIYDQSTARLHPFFHPFAESLTEHLSSLKRSLLKDMVFQEPADYFNFLRRYATSCHVPFEGTPLKGLQILGLLETRNLKFDRVFVLDANEDVISGVKKEDSLLPGSVRKALGLTDYRDRTNLMAYYLDVLIKGSTEAHLFYVENDRKQRSRFVEGLIWQKEKSIGRVGEDAQVSTISYAIGLENRMPPPVPKDAKALSLLQEFSFSATSLDRYLKCPLSFYYHYVLGLTERDEVPEEIEGQELGRLVHTCLHAYFEKRKGRRLTPEQIDTDEMQSMVDDIFVREYGEDISGSLYLVRRQVRHHLFDFLVRYQLPSVQEQDIIILALEQAVAAQWKGFRLKGRIDRVEKRNDEIVIIDYKTGARPDRLRIHFDKLMGAPREKWPAVAGSVQLPFYLLTYAAATGSSIDTIHPLFLMLGRSSISNAIEERLFVDGHDRSEQTRLLEHVMGTLLSEVVDPEAPFRPTILPTRFCPWCEFQSLCGTRWVKK